jgi:hypothetical protein
VEDAANRMEALVKLGYSGMDIVGTLFKVVKGSPNLQEFQKLEFIRVRLSCFNFFLGVYVWGLIDFCGGFLGDWEYAYEDA